MALIQDNNVIQALLANRADNSFGDPVGSGRPDRGPYARHPDPRKLCRQLFAIDRIPIVDHA